MAGVKEKLEKARVENQAQIEEMQEQREVEVEEITRNTERIKEQVDGVGEGLKEQLQAEYESVAQQAQDLSDKSKEDYVEPLEPPELQNVEDELPYSLDIFLGAADDLYDVVELEIDDATLCAQPNPPLQRSTQGLCACAQAEDGRAACACRYEDDGWDAYKAEKIAARKSDGGSMTIDDAKFAEARTQLDQAVRLLA